MEENLAKAIEALEEARRRAPDRPEPVLNLALAHARQGNKKQGQELAREVLKLVPQGDLHDQAQRLIQALS
jgi:cytochrome c-type biogenesis protein CcmH/NrfG